MARTAKRAVDSGRLDCSRRRRTNEVGPDSPTDDIRLRLAAGLESIGTGDLSFSRGRTLQIKAFRAEIASLTESDNQWVSARAFVDARLGTSYTEKLDERSILDVARRTRDNAAFAGPDPGNRLYSGEEAGEHDARRGRHDTMSTDQ